MTASSNPWSSIPGPEDITREETENGIVALARENFQSPSVVISGYLQCGSMYDPDDKLGLSYYASRALMRGTLRFRQQEIYEKLESIGASLGFSAGVHSISFGGRALAEDLAVLLDLLAESLMNPVFPEEEVTRLRAQMLTSLAIREQDTESRSSLAFEETVYQGHPYARPEDGYSHTIGNITRDDLAIFHHNHYSPRGMVIAVVGAVDRENVRDEVASRFGEWRNPAPYEPVFPRLAPPAAAVRMHIPLEEKYQTDIVMGTLGPARKSDDYIAASLGNHILGQFGMMGRIGESVRERAGLAYHASSSINSGMLAGTWEINAGVNPDKVDLAVDLIKKELKQFVSEPVTQEEINDSTSNLVGQIPLWLESNSGVANALLRMERFDLGLDYFRRYPGMLQAVTTADILETAQRYLDVDRLVVVSAGPKNE